MALANVGLARTFGYGKNTQTAGTIITQVIPPVGGKRAKLTKLVYTCGATLHTITVMRALARTTLSAAAAAAQAVINLTRDPGAYAANATSDGRATPSVADNVIAANDFLLIAKPDGTWHFAQVSSVATLAITLTANVPTGGFAAGADVYFFGIITDTDPNTGAAHPILTLIGGTSALTTLTGDGAPLVETVLQDSPMVIHSGNATNAGVLEQASGAYGP